MKNRKKSLYSISEQVNSLWRNMGHCTIHYTNNEIATEEQCLLWNTQTQRHIIYGFKLEYNLKTWIQFNLYNLIHIRRLSGNDIKFYKFTANVNLPTKWNFWIYFRASDISIRRQYFWVAIWCDWQNLFGVYDVMCCSAYRFLDLYIQLILFFQ